MLGLPLGIIVDAAVILVENIYRNFQAGRFFVMIASADNLQIAGNRRRREPPDTAGVRDGQAQHSINGRNVPAEWWRLFHSSPAAE